MMRIEPIATKLQAIRLYKSVEFPNDKEGMKKNNSAISTEASINLCFLFFRLSRPSTRVFWASHAVSRSADRSIAGQTQGTEELKLTTLTLTWHTVLSERQGPWGHAPKNIQNKPSPEQAACPVPHQDLDWLNRCRYVRAESCRCIITYCLYSYYAYFRFQNIFDMVTKNKGCSLFALATALLSCKEIDGEIVWQVSYIFRSISLKHLMNHPRYPSEIPTLQLCQASFHALTSHSCPRSGNMLLQPMRRAARRLSSGQFISSWRLRMKCCPLVN